MPVAVVEHPMVLIWEDYKASWDVSSAKARMIVSGTGGYVLWR